MENFVDVMKKGMGGMFRAKNKWAIYILSVKSLDAVPHSMVFLYFHDYLHCRFSLKASKL